MNAHRIIAALLQLWPQLPDLAGPAWSSIRPELLRLLRTFADAPEAESRAESVIAIEELLDQAPNVMPAIYAELAPGWVTRGDRNIPPVSPESFDAGPSAEEVQARASAHVEAETQARQPGDERVINAWIDGLAHDAPLRLGTTYDLLFDVGLPREGSRATEPFDPPFPNDEDVEVLVLIDTEDFTIHGDDQQTMIVPREGASKNAAIFHIEPKRRGDGVIKAVFIARNRVFHKLKLTLSVESPERAAHALVASGTTIGSAYTHKIGRGQAVNVMLLAREAGYQVILQGGGITRGFLRISTAEIAGWLKYARTTLHDIVHLQDARGNYIYQDDDTTIPPAVHADALKQLAGVGLYLFDELFYGNNGPDARAIGDLLRSLSRKHQLSIRIAAERFFFPWSLIYDGADPDHPDPNHFWGFKHIIEYLPEFNIGTPVNFEPTIAVSDTLDMAYVCHQGIDAQFRRPLVDRQRRAFSQLPGVSVKDYPNVQDLVNLMKERDAPPLIYFYCHAATKFPGEDGGVDDSSIGLTDASIRLRELKSKASTALPPLASAPLAFLNACESAELSPYIYDGLMPYMLARGVRGMIGTEVETPALFAAEFAVKFMQRFTAGEITLGELLLELRREYLFEKNNVLGLLYALYSSGDVMVQRQF